MSARFLEVKAFYDSGKWRKARVRNAVKAKWITAEEYKQITGEDYE